jgi:hypothetical protein
MNDSIFFCVKTTFTHTVQQPRNKKIPVGNDFFCVKDLEMKKGENVTIVLFVTYYFTREDDDNRSIVI